MADTDVLFSSFIFLDILFVQKFDFSVSLSSSRFARRQAIEMKKLR